MFTILFIIVMRVLKYTFIASMVAVYSEIGFGGEYVGNIVGAFKAVAVQIDWASLISSIGDEVFKLAKVFVDRLSEVDLSDTNKVVECLIESCEKGKVLNDGDLK